MQESILHLIVSKINVKSALLFLALLLCSAGIYMCFTELKAIGSIDIKSALIEGKINTGSLGIIVIFLGILVAFAAKKVSLQEKHIEITHGDLKVTAANMQEHEWQNIVDCVREHEEQHTKRQKILRENASLLPTALQNESENG